MHNYSCQAPWWWIIDHLCQSAISHTLPQTKRGNMEGSEKKTNKTNDNHMMTNTSWKDPSTSKVAQGILYRAVKLTQVVERTRALCNTRAFGISLRARRIHFEAVGRSRLLILAPLSISGIKSRTERKFLEAGGQHFMTITL